MQRKALGSNAPEGFCTKTSLWRFILERHNYDTFCTNFFWAKRKLHAAHLLCHMNRHSSAKQPASSRRPSHRLELDSGKVAEQHRTSTASGNDSIPFQGMSTLVRLQDLCQQINDACYVSLNSFKWLICHFLSSSISSMTFSLSWLRCLIAEITYIAVPSA